MLKGTLIHPQIAAALALCGHGDKILIADGNYPLQSKSGAPEKVYLGLTPGTPTVPEVLQAVRSAVCVESFTVMSPSDGSVPEIFEQFREQLGGIPMAELSRYQFYDACRQPDVRLAISTGEQRVFANILLTVGAL